MRLGVNVACVIGVLCDMDQTYKMVCGIWVSKLNSREWRKAGQAYLVTVSPGEVLGADVLVGVLGALLEWGHVAPVLPVLLPQVVGIETAGNHDGNDSAIYSSINWSEIILVLLLLQPRKKTYKIESLRHRSVRSH